MAVDTAGHILALHVTPANELDNAQVGALAKDVHETTAPYLDYIAPRFVIETMRNLTWSGV